MDSDYVSGRFVHALDGLIDLVLSHQVCAGKVAQSQRIFATDFRALTTRPYGA